MEGGKLGGRVVRRRGEPEDDGRRGGLALPGSGGGRRGRPGMPQSSDEMPVAVRAIGIPGPVPGGCG